MSNYDNYFRVFDQLRMHPWVPEHKSFIDAELAKLSVADPKKHEFLKDAYDEKMKAYEKSLIPAPAVIPDEIPVETESKIEEPVTTPKKRGRKPSTK